MIRIQTYIPAHLDEVVLREGDDWGVNMEGITMMASQYPAWTLTVDGEIAIIIGVWKLWEGNWECWSVPTDAARGHGMAIVKATRRIIRMVLNTPGIHRLTALSREDKPEYNKWLELLGFKREYVQEKAYDDRVDVIGFVNRNTH